MSSAVGAGATLGHASPGDSVRVGIVGVRGQGGAHIQAYSKMPNVEIAAICDIDEAVLDKSLGEIEKSGKKRPARFTDIRKMLEDKNIDAVSIATPNHSHTLQTIWSLQAGKNVYCEKPCSHNIFESQQIVAAARKYKKIVQHGVNARSHGGPMEAVKHMREGLIGDVYMALGLCFKRRDTIGRAVPEPVPAGVHYDLWLGPAPKTEFTKNRFHYNWHWFWDYGNGDFGNQGIHELDIARWGLGVKYPSKISAIGGHFMFDDDQQTPNTLNIAYEFNEGGKKKMMTFEVRHWDTGHETGVGGKEPGGPTVGNLFYGSKGFLAIDGYNKYQSWLGNETNGKAYDQGPAKTEGGSNWANFIDAVRANKSEVQNNEIEEGAITCTLMHLGNISYRLGRTLNFDSEKFVVTGDAEANKMFARNYRAPFIVPAKV
ncbi:MAG: Gfo/Idh/MocA family oxidoreductase [Bryobacteraceae bacterium]